MQLNYSPMYSYILQKIVCHTICVYLIFESTKDMILKIKSTAKIAYIRGGRGHQYIEYLEKYVHEKLTIHTKNTKIISNLRKNKILYHQKMTNSKLKVPIVPYNTTLHCTLQCKVVLFYFPSYK